MPSIAFFGATGGSTISCLAPALQAGYHCTALARSPTKLTNTLAQRGLPQSTIRDNLSIISGTVTDLHASHVDIIISGIGGKLLFDGPLKLNPTLDNPTICQDAVRTILTAAREVADSSSSSEASSSSGAGNDGNKPTLIVLSTTGISDKRDLPFAMMPLYYWMLKVPHEDKKVMEALIRDEMAKPVEGGGVGGYVIVRPNLLTEGDGDGLEKVRVGGGGGSGCWVCDCEGGCGEVGF
ncbi:hypothetical protein SI65_07906 [Aspergillus cristatus]|uniref:NAD(P)-binding domain-containing protein n=1 Tax=Aspergillus cristatus TaxID=573508 RepID=A0A1E3B632_ASPCR|nr:hypothetical protein SI65_07906 [Aspergillus cristatus]